MKKSCRARVLNDANAITRAFADCEKKDAHLLSRWWTRIGVEQTKRCQLLVIEKVKAHAGEVRAAFHLQVSRGNNSCP